MKTWIAWAVLVGISSTVCSTILNGTAGFFAAAILCLAIFPIITMFVACKESPWALTSGLGTAIAMFVGYIVVLLLISIITGDKDIATKIMGYNTGFLGWAFSEGIWYTVLIGGGSFIVALMIGAGAES